MWGFRQKSCDFHAGIVGKASYTLGASPVLYFEIDVCDDWHGRAAMRIAIIAVREESMNLQGIRLVHWMRGLLFTFGATGCSMGMVQTAQTVGKGGYELSIDPGFAGLINEGTIGPTVNAAYRYGVTDRFDLGFRLGTSIVEAQTKFLFTEPSNETIAVSLAPAAGILIGLGGPIYGFNFPLPLLIGFKMGPHELTLGPRLQANIYSIYDGQSSRTPSSLSAGLSVGFAAQTSDKLRVLPELSMSTPFYIGGPHAVSAYEYYATKVGVFSYSFNLGFQVGSPRKKFKAL